MRETERYPLVLGTHLARELRRDLFGALIYDDIGATAIEYGLIAALIAVAAIAAFQLVGSNLSTVFHTIATHL
jgi:pilus assembly protein Flp/PilA